MAFWCFAYLPFCLVLLLPLFPLLLLLCLFPRQGLPRVLRGWLPLLVLAFWMVPLLWPVQDAPVGAAVPMSHALRYVFGVWLAGIILCFLLWWRTARQIAQEAQD